jgi:hypothetical protein
VPHMVTRVIHGPWTEVHRTALTGPVDVFDEPVEEDYPVCLVVLGGVSPLGEVGDSGRESAFLTARPSKYGSRDPGLSGLWAAEAPLSFRRRRRNLTATA